jgi:hypothetical protein
MSALLDLFQSAEMSLVFGSASSAARAISG